MRVEDRGLRNEDRRQMTAGSLIEKETLKKRISNIE
jgi:hypothetical protein